MNKYKELAKRLSPERKYPLQPYKKFKKHPACSVVNQIIEDLVENQDLVETNVRKNLVGYIVKRLIENDLLK